MRDIMILSRPEAIFYCEGQHDRPSVMISISDPFEPYDDAPFITQDNSLQEILPLSFCDAEEPGPDVYGRMAGEKDLMQREDALRIRELLNRHPDCDIIVHCDAGMSRSAGVAAAILEAAGGDRASIFGSPYYQPNLHCYGVVRRVLTEPESNTAREKSELL